jgi:hypothetical protein
MDIIGMLAKRLNESLRGKEKRAAPETCVNPAPLLFCSAIVKGFICQEISDKFFLS